VVPAHHRESFLYEHSRDREILPCVDVSFRSEERLRPGSIADATDAAQFAELETLGSSTRVAGGTTAREIEGPRALTIATKIKENMDKKLVHLRRSAFYTLGPLTTDIVTPG